MGTTFAVIAVIVAFWCGWNSAHVTVATECERLGGFFVGKTVYRCTAVVKEQPGA